MVYVHGRLITAPKAGETAARKTPISRRNVYVVDETEKWKITGEPFSPKIWKAARKSGKIQKVAGRR
jgi:hypothetical protein